MLVEHLLEIPLISSRQESGSPEEEELSSVLNFKPRQRWRARRKMISSGDGGVKTDSCEWEGFTGCLRLDCHLVPAPRRDAVNGRVET